MRAITPAADIGIRIDVVMLELCTATVISIPITIATTKTLLARIVAGSPESDEALLGRCYGSEDFREGVAAFVARRPARWTGR